jgi:hypothetical protein
MMWPRKETMHLGFAPGVGFFTLCSDMFMVFVYDDNDDLWME